MQAFQENKQLRTVIAQKQNPDLPEYFVAKLVDVLDNMDDTVPFTFKHLEVNFDNNETAKAT